MAAYYDDRMKKWTVVDRKEGYVIGYYNANSKDDALLMAKADQERWSIGE